MCVGTLETFIASLVAEAGNLALKCSPQEVSISEVDPLHVVSAPDTGRLLEAFSARVDSLRYWPACPVHVIVCRAATIGAASQASRWRGSERALGYEHESTIMSKSETTAESVLLHLEIAMLREKETRYDVLVGCTGHFRHHR